DSPGGDIAGYLLANAFTQLADTSGQSGNVSFSVTLGQSFGFRINTIDNTGEPGILTVSNFNAPGGVAASVPEPGTLPLVLLSLGVIFALRQTRKTRLAYARGSVGLLGIVFLAGVPVFAQTQNHYVGTNVTGQLVLTTTVN